MRNLCYGMYGTGNRATSDLDFRTRLGNCIIVSDGDHNMLV